MVINSAVDGVSFIVTVFNKARYLPRVVAALAVQQGAFEREFIFVDDGSEDGSAELMGRLTAGWAAPVTILRQENCGASAATNRGAERARLPWLKLCDGDDLLLPDATAALLAAAAASGHSLAYGELGHYDAAAADPLAGLSAAGPAEPVDGLARFIRNCPANSSALLVSAARYQAAGGCDERLVSPDQALFLRLFATGGGVLLGAPVALVPQNAPGRLSDQRRRSRYESVLALYHLVTETRGLDKAYARLAARRALSRAWRFHRAHGGRLCSRHLLRFWASALGLPLDPAQAIHRALGAFTPDGRPQRPDSWQPGALRERRRDAALEPAGS